MWGGGAGHNTNAYLNDHFAFICIHLNNKKGVWRGIHEMQISDRINDKSISFCLISLGSWLIVLLLCNYAEFAQGLGIRAVGCS